MGPLIENSQVVPAILPIDVAAGNQIGDYVSLKNYNRCEIKFVKNAGTAGQDPTIALYQATAVAGTGAKALNFTTIYRKQAATNLTAVGTVTKTTQTAAATYTEGSSGEETAVWIIDIQASDLDVANGFDCIRADIQSGGSTAGAIGYLEYRLYEPRFAQATTPSAIAD